jgi:hypothetical protein
MKRWLLTVALAVSVAAIQSHAQLPEGSISGHIQGVNGHALASIPVTLLGVRYSSGRQFLYAAGSSDTNELGEYHILRVQPGEYYVRINNTREDNPSAHSAYVSRTYYPGASDMQQAKLVALKQGQMATGIDFHAVPIPKGVTISGIVVNFQTGGNPQTGGLIRRSVGIYLIPIREGLAEPVLSTSVDAASKEDTSFPFEIDGVPPGTYDFYATFADSTSFGEPDPSGITIRFGEKIGTRYFSTKKRVEVTQQNVQGLTVTIERGAEIRGRLSIHGDDLLKTSTGLTGSGPDEVRVESMTKNLPFYNGSMWSFSGPMEDDDRFTITGLLPGNYQLTSIGSIQDLQYIDDAYLEDLRQSGQSVYKDGIIKVGKSNVTVELVVNENGGRIHGSVEIPSSGSRSRHSVILVPDTPRRENRALYKFVSTDEEGEFTFLGVAPGRYKIFAFDGVSADGRENPDLIRTYEQRGVPVAARAGIVVHSLPIPIISVP